MDEAEHAVSHLIASIESESDIYFFKPNELITANTKIAIFDLNGNISTSEMELQLTKLPLQDDLPREVTVNNQSWLVYDLPGYFEEKEVFWIRIVRSFTNIENTLRNIRILIFTSIPIFIIISTVISMFLASRSLAPINNLIKTTRNIGKGNLSQRLKVFDSHDEVGVLTQTFNEMLERLEVAFKRESEFATSASHELRTPLSVILAQTEEALSGNKEIKDYKQALKLILKKSKKINYLVSQLLTLSRDYDKNFTLNKEIIDLDMLLEDVIDEMKNKAKAKGIKIFFNKKQDVKINADQILIATLLINIIDNSIKYNKKSGFIKINLNRENEIVEISIEDSGVGIAKEEIPKIFDRFYRVDK
ncbi:MAG: HAMP domain-containing histidine kinase, partial [Candidatus Lokiarchaeota archaeon]|nr:HAMP domain-containing histidine kinase [Candidatus Lokiarchaeota archaeon]